MKLKKQRSTKGIIRAKHKSPNKVRSIKTSGRRRQPASKAAFHSLNLTVHPSDKCQISEGVASAPGLSVPSARFFRLWAARIAAGLALVKAIVEDGEPVVAFVEQVIDQLIV